MLENVITDLHSFYHPPTSLTPLQVDAGKKGKDDDHNVIIMAPLANENFKLERKKKVVRTPFQKLTLRGSEKTLLYLTGQRSSMKIM